MAVPDTQRPLSPCNPRAPLLHSVDCYTHVAYSACRIWQLYAWGCLGMTVSDTQRSSCRLYDTLCASTAPCGLLYTCSLICALYLAVLCHWDCLGMAMFATHRPPYHLYDAQRVISSFCVPRCLCSLTAHHFWQLYAEGCLGMAVSDTQAPPVAFTTPRRQYLPPVNI
jgi:hypothetical protein